MRVVIGIPCMEMVNTDFMQYVLGLNRPCEVSFAISKGSLVYDARNKIAEMAINGGFDCVIWLDSDMTFEPDIIERFMEHYEDGKDYVSGLFFARRLPTHPCIYKSIGHDTDEEGRTIQCRTEVFLEYPEETFEIGASGFAGVMTSVKMLKDIGLRHGPPFYPRYGFGEDLSFCWLAKQDGYKMYCDPTIKLGHIGYSIFNEETYEAQTERIGYAEI